MNNSSQQNGRRTTSLRSSVPKDPRTRKALPSGTATSADPNTICRDYIWGICTKGAECKYRHELEYNSMRATLKFCHNFQNRGACDWPDCTYLHVSRDEENLFLNTGQIPRLLAERYAAMSMYEYIGTAPPPPPPAPSLVPASALLAPPPPPPPPTSTTTATRNAPPVYTAHQPAQLVVTASVPPPPLPVMFDPSRPPPPLPTKRHSSDSTEAGTSGKLRKVDEPYSTCNNCIQRELRIEIYKQETEKMRQEEEKQRLILKKKLEDFQNGKVLLKSILSPKWYNIVDTYIENIISNQGNGIFSQPPPPSSSSSSSSYAPETSNGRQFLLGLIRFLLSCGSSRNILESLTSSSRGSSVLESLTGVGRQNNATTTASPNMVQALLEALRLSESGQRVPSEQRTESERAGAAGNGITRISNSGAPSMTGPSSLPSGIVPPAPSYYAQLHRPPAPPPASAPQPTSQPQPYYSQYAGLSGSAAQFAAAAPGYPSGSNATPQYPPSHTVSGDSQQMHNARNYQYSGTYPPYYPTASPYQ